VDPQLIGRFQIPSLTGERDPVTDQTAYHKRQEGRYGARKLRKLVEVQLRGGDGIPSLPLKANLKLRISRVERGEERERLCFA